MNEFTHDVLDADWAQEAEQLEERIEHLERQENLISWNLILTAIVIVILTVKVMFS